MKNRSKDHRLFKAELSRDRWKAAYIELCEIYRGTIGAPPLAKWDGVDREKTLAGIRDWSEGLRDAHAEAQAELERCHEEAAALRRRAATVEGQYCNLSAEIAKISESVGITPVLSSADAPLIQLRMLGAKIFSMEAAKAALKPAWHPPAEPASRGRSLDPAALLVDIIEAWRTGASSDTDDAIREAVASLAVWVLEDEPEIKIDPGKVEEIGPVENLTIHM